jgi:peptidylprolyl isomerase domain and WD repeat-containing protein 1
MKLGSSTNSPQYSDQYDCVLSADTNGFVEYWRPAEPFGLPKNVPGMWEFKSKTDLYEFKKVHLS